MTIRAPARDLAHARPRSGAFCAVDSGSIPAVSAFEGADPAFATGSPLDGSSERGPMFLRSSSGRRLPLRGITTSRTPRSCRLTHRCDPSGVCPASRCRVGAANWRVASTRSDRSLTPRASRASASSGGPQRAARPDRRRCGCAAWRRCRARACPRRETGPAPWSESLRPPPESASAPPPFDRPPWPAPQESVGYDTLLGNTMVSARNLVVRSTFASVALASSA
jgi:hypothetical protein